MIHLIISAWKIEICKFVYRLIKSDQIESNFQSYELIIILILLDSTNIYSKVKRYSRHNASLIRPNFNIMTRCVRPFEIAKWGKLIVDAATFHLRRDAHLRRYQHILFFWYVAHDSVSCCDREKFKFKHLCKLCSFFKFKFLLIHLHIILKHKFSSFDFILNKHDTLWAKTMMIWRSPFISQSIMIFNQKISLFRHWNVVIKWCICFCPHIINFSGNKKIIHITR